MTWEVDSFKVNWTEKTRGKVITSVTGYSYQVESWKADYFKKFNPKIYETRVITTVDDRNGMITMTVSRGSVPT